MSSSFKNLFVWAAAAVVVLFPAAVLGECTCEPEEEGDESKSLALKYKVGAIAAILVASAVGVLLPVAGMRVPALSPERNFFFVVKAFAAGVLLSTAFIHILPEAFESLTSPCIPASPWGDFPFTGFIAMLAAIGTLMVDTYATSYYRRRPKVKTAEGGSAGDEEGGAEVVPVHAHAHESVSLTRNSDETDLLRHRVISQVLELGIIVHSVIIGIALGASQSPKTISPLIAALSFHQFFEGIGLGGCIVQGRFKARAITIMAVFFSITTPVGIAIGIGIANIYSETSSTALIVQGVLNAASAGILVYMALVDLLAADFMSPKMQSDGKLQMGANLSLLIGVGCMSVIAKWA